MPPNSARDQTAIAIEAAAWDLRTQGHSQRRIAERLGVGQATVHRALRRVERRELARMSDRVEREKVRQTLILEYVIDEAFQAFERSKQPRRRASSRTGRTGGPGGGKVESSDVVHRDGDPVWLDRVMEALAQIRAVWGLNSTPGAAGVSYAQVVANVKANAARFDDARAALPPPDGATDA